MTAVSTTTGPDGEVLHLVASPPANLPTVTKRDIEQAWDAAQAGTAGIAAPPRGFRFARPEGAPIELILNDRDAAAWAVAVDGIADLSTPRGISLCLRLLGLVELMSRAGWIRPWFTLGRAGTEIAPALLHAVAQSPLNEAGGFDETALRALLPRQPAPRRPGDGH